MTKNEPIDLSDSSELSSTISDGMKDELDDQSDMESLIDVTPSTPRKKPNKNYDKDMPAPTYWVEVISPITHKVYPVDPFSSFPTAVATTPEHLLRFEPRGAQADKAKQVFAYVIAYSADGTAKDVVTRYLKKHMWPGRTKGYRLMPEKVPVYNSRGKIKKYEIYDWFKSVMSGYQRTKLMRTAADDIEDSTDLVPAQPEKKEVDTTKDTLQSLKSSAEFVLERHLRREEAIKPGSKPVKTFTSGKGDDVKEEPIFLRKN